jgi:general secretion pathway protein G
MRSSHPDRGFTLIEILVVISIIGLLSAVVLASLSSARQRARDAQRISAIRQMQTALDLYYADNGQYPDGDGAGTGGWDTPGNGSFITALVPNYLPVNLRDPVTNDAAGNLRYARFASGTSGCSTSRGAFYVLGVADMETSAGAHPLSSGWSCPTRNFQSEMEYVVGKFEK